MPALHKPTEDRAAALVRKGEVSHGEWSAPNEGDREQADCLAEGKGYPIVSGGKVSARAVGNAAARASANGHDEIAAAARRLSDLIHGDKGGDKGTSLSADDPPHEFSSTQIDLPPEVAAKVKAMAARIPDGHLAADGREDRPHVTVKYGLHTGDPEDVRKALAGEGPVKFRLGKASIFPANEAQAQRGGDKFDVVKLDVHGLDLHRLNKKLADALPHTDTHAVYQPHVTLAYVKPGLGQRYAGMGDVDGQEVAADRIVFSGKDGKEKEIPLTGGNLSLSDVGDWRELSGTDPAGNPVSLQVQADGAVGKDEAARYCPPGTTIRTRTHDGERHFAVVAHDAHPHGNFVVPRLVQAAGPAMPEAMGGAAADVTRTPTAPASTPRADGRRLAALAMSAGTARVDPARLAAMALSSFEGPGHWVTIDEHHVYLPGAPGSKTDGRTIISHHEYDRINGPGAAARAIAEHKAKGENGGMETPKPIHEMNLAEYEAAGGKDYKQGHERAIRQAIESGKPVSDEAIGRYAGTVAASEMKKLRDVHGADFVDRLRVVAAPVKEVSELGTPGSDGKYTVRRQQNRDGSFVTLEKGDVIDRGEHGKIVTKASGAHVGRHDGSAHGYYQSVTLRDAKPGEAEKAIAAARALKHGGMPENRDYPDLKRKQMGEFAAMVRKSLTK